MTTQEARQGQEHLSITATSKSDYRYKNMFKVMWINLSLILCVLDFPFASITCEKSAMNRVEETFWKKKGVFLKHSNHLIA